MLLFVCQISSVKLWCYWLWRLEMSLVLSYSLCSVWSFVISSSFFALSSFVTLTLFDIQYLRANTVWCSDLTCTLQGYEGVTIATSKTEAGFVQVVLTDQENGMNLILWFMIWYVSRLCVFTDDILTEPEYVKFMYHKYYILAADLLLRGLLNGDRTVFCLHANSLTRLLSLTKRKGGYTMHIPHYIFSAATRSSPTDVFIPRSLSHWSDEIS